MCFILQLVPVMSMTLVSFCDMPRSRKTVVFFSVEALANQVVGLSEAVMWVAQGLVLVLGVVNITLLEKDVHPWVFQ